MGNLRKFESAPSLESLSEEQILGYAAEAREIRSQGGIVPEGIFALSLAWVMREYKALRKDSKHVLDEILPALPPEIESKSNDDSVPQEESPAEL